MNESKKSRSHRRKKIDGGWIYREITISQNPNVDQGYYGHYHFTYQSKYHGFGLLREAISAINQIKDQQNETV